MSPDFGRTRLRIVALSMAIVTAILLATGGIVYAIATRALMQSVDATLIANSATAQTEVSESEQGELEQVGFRSGLFYLVLDSTDGRVISNPQQVDVAQLPPEAPGVSSARFFTTEINGDMVRMYARPVNDVVLVVGESLVPVESASGQLLTVLLLGGGIGILLSLCGGWLLASRSLVPIQRAFNRQQEFVADASHELRTPLTILHTTADLLLQQIDQPAAQNRLLVEELRQEIVRMERLTRDLLTVARSDRGELVLSLGSVDLRALANDLKARMEVLANTRGIELTVNSSATERRPVVEGDPERLQQVGLIVIDNALNHTPRGGSITISVSAADGLGILTVDDTGEGIPSEHLDRVFERFHRIDSSRSRVRGGAGLGLAIAHALITAHGGTIAVANRRNGGTRVTIQIPLAEVEPDVPDAPASEVEVTRS